jgi:hypothetical protein
MGRVGSPEDYAPQVGGPVDDVRAIGLPDGPCQATGSPSLLSRIAIRVRRPPAFITEAVTDRA